MSRPAPVRMARPPSDVEIRNRYGLTPDATVRHANVGPDGRVRLDPDSFTYATVPSRLEWAAWDRPTVVAGHPVSLSVRGTWVGEGNPVEVALKDGRNRTVGRASAEMYRDRAVVDVLVSRDAEGVVAADVHLPDLGLSVTSGPLLVLPWIELSARWEEGGAAADRAREGGVVSLVVGVDARRDLLADLEGASVRLVVRVGDPPEPVVELRGAVRDREVRVDWRAVLPGARLDIARQAALDLAADRAGAPRGEPPYRYVRPALSFTAELHGVRATSPELPFADPLALSVADLAAGGAASGRTVSLTWPDGRVEERTLDADGRLSVEDAPPGPVEVSVSPGGAAEGGAEPPTPPEDADAVVDVPARAGRGHVAVVPTGQHTHLRLLPFVLSP